MSLFKKKEQTDEAVFVRDVFRRYADTGGLQICVTNLAKHDDGYACFGEIKTGTVRVGDELIFNSSSSGVVVGLRSWQMKPMEEASAKDGLVFLMFDDVVNPQYVRKNSIARRKINSD